MISGAYFTRREGEREREREREREYKVVLMVKVNCPWFAHATVTNNVVFGLPTRLRLGLAVLSCTFASPSRH